MPGFYTKFSKTIHDNIDPDIPVWVIGEPFYSSVKSDILSTNHNVEGRDGTSVRIKIKFSPFVDLFSLSIQNI